MPYIVQTATAHMPPRPGVSEQLDTEGSALDVLRREAVRLMHPDPDGGDANWVQVTEGLRHGIYSPTLPAAEIARLAAADLAEAAEEWQAEQAHLALLR